MAEILARYDFASSLGSGRHSVHPLNEWLDGQIRRLKKGIDFDDDAKLVSNRIRTKAYTMKKSVHIVREDDETLIVQAVARTSKVGA